MGAPSCWACLQGAEYINILTFEIAPRNREFRRHSASIHGALVYFTLIFESENMFWIDSQLHDVRSCQIADGGLRRVRMLGARCVKRVVDRA